MNPKKYIQVVAYICIKDGKILSTRSKGQDIYCIPGGKLDSNETNEQALIREVKEEVALDLLPESIQYYGTFEAPAHGKSEGLTVRMDCYTADFIGEPRADSEKEEIVWLDYDGKDKSSLVDKLVFDDLRAKGFL